MLLFCQPCYVPGSYLQSENRVGEHEVCRTCSVYSSRSFPHYSPPCCLPSRLICRPNKRLPWPLSSGQVHPGKLPSKRLKVLEWCWAFIPLVAITASSVHQVGLFISFGSFSRILSFKIRWLLFALVICSWGSTALPILKPWTCNILHGFLVPCLSLSLWFLY